MLRRLMKANFSSWTAKRLSESYLSARKPSIFDPDKFIDQNLREELEEKLKGYDKGQIPVIVIIEKMQLDENDNIKEVLKREAIVKDFLVESFRKEEVKDVVAFFIALEDKWINFISGASASSEFDDSTLKYFKDNSIEGLKNDDHDKVVKDIVDTILESKEKFKIFNNSNSSSSFDKESLLRTILRISLGISFLFMLMSFYFSKHFKTLTVETKEYLTRLKQLSTSRPVEQLMEENCNFCFERLQSEPQAIPENMRVIDKNDPETAIVLKCNHIFHRKCLKRYFAGFPFCAYCSRNHKIVDYPSLFNAYLDITNLRLVLKNRADLPQNFFVGPKVDTGVVFDPIESVQYFNP